MEEITAQELSERMANNPKVRIIDVRETNETAVGMIPGAINIPLGLLEFKMNELDKNEEYILVCRSGARSGRAVQFLNYYGYKAINLAGGMIAWNQLAA